MRELDEYEERALDDYEEHLRRDEEEEPPEDPLDDLERDWLRSGGRANYRCRR